MNRHVTLHSLVFACTAFAVFAISSESRADIKNEYVCESNDIKRIISLRVAPSSRTMCDVFYQKPDEGIAPQVAWFAQNDYDYCKEKFGVLVDNLARSGWWCSTDFDVDEADVAKQNSVENANAYPSDMEGVRPIGANPLVPEPVSQRPKPVGGSGKLLKLIQGRSGHSPSDYEELTEEEYMALAEVSDRDNNTTPVQTSANASEEYMNKCEAWLGDAHEESAAICECTLNEFGRLNTSLEDIAKMARFDEESARRDCPSYYGGLARDDLSIEYCIDIWTLGSFEFDTVERCVVFIEHGR